MSDRPTPETDGAERMAFAQEYMVPTDFARKLERERDEAREAAAKWESSFDDMERAGAEQARRADENREWALRAERERDEAREALAATKHYLTKERDDALAQIVQAECRAERFCQERDEARIAIIATLEENRHLADGDDCTLAKLKSVVPEWK